MSFFPQSIVFLAYALNTLIFIRVILSWLGNGDSNRLTNFVFEATEPILSPIRKALPRTGIFDFSPLIAIILVDILKGFLLRLF